MKWITIKLMKYQLRLAKRNQENQENDIIKRAYQHAIECYRDTIMFLDADS